MITSDTSKGVSLHLWCHCFSNPTLRWRCAPFALMTLHLPSCVAEHESQFLTDLKTAPVQGDDFSSGTSSRSTKLIHGGVRYLQKAIMKLDYKQCQSVTGPTTESCESRVQRSLQGSAIIEDQTLPTGAKPLSSLSRLCVCMRVHACAHTPPVA
ncbi:uncharacterized protein LOC143412997 isoform X2 [Maylandia zebra]|uniref:uncharacterized protein LOC143412997 isoform X2 n=1 Tax=Maylandia zebra TaxID=106582 RepID=UPI00403CD52F